MTNLKNIRIITEKLREILKGIGVCFETEGGEHRKVNGNIYYKGEAFEHGYGGRAYYINANFLIKIHLQQKDLKTLTALEQEVGHKIREKITLETLCIKGYTSEKIEGENLITRVLVNKIEINKPDPKPILCNLPYKYKTEAIKRNASLKNQSTMGIDLMIRYREV